MLESLQLLQQVACKIACSLITAYSKLLVKNCTFFDTSMIYMGLLLGCKI